MPVIEFTSDEVKAAIEAFDNHYLTGIGVLFPNEQLDRNTRTNLRSQFAQANNVVDLSEYQRAVMLGAIEGYVMRFNNPELTFSNQQLRTRDALQTLRQKLINAANPTTTEDNPVDPRKKRKSLFS